MAGLGTTMAAGGGGLGLVVLVVALLLGVNPSRPGERGWASVIGND